MTYAAFPTYGTGQTGWYCPGCQKYHAPSVTTCPNPSPNYWVSPYNPNTGGSSPYRCPVCQNNEGCTCTVVLNEYK